MIDDDTRNHICEDMLRTGALLRIADKVGNIDDRLDLIGDTLNGIAEILCPDRPPSDDGVRPDDVEDEVEERFPLPERDTMVSVSRVQYVMAQRAAFDAGAAWGANR